MFYNNVFYFKLINEIGGIENFFFQLAKKYRKYDITIFYKQGDKKQIERLQKLVRCIKYRGQNIECKKAFFNFNLDIIDNVKADEYVCILHVDYKAMNLKPPSHPKIDKYIGITQLVCDSFNEITGMKAELCYNPVAIDRPPKALRLVSATRLTSEKGKDRMIQLANALDGAGVKYEWIIYTNDTNAIDNPNVFYAKPKLDILPYIRSADFLVQLSDNEGYCYSVVEALSVGTPVIVTPCPVFKELGLNNKNSITIDFDMQNIPIERIKKFNMPKYEAPADNWNNLLAKGDSTYSPEEAERKIKVKVIRPYFDIELERLVHSDEILYMMPLRAEQVENAGYIEVERND